MIMHNAVSRRVAQRFVAGESLDDAIAAARNVNNEMQLASLDLLGENVSDEAGARRAAENYLSIFKRIEKEKLDANVSLKLTQLGLDLSEGLCEGLWKELSRTPQPREISCASIWRFCLHRAHGRNDQARSRKVFGSRHGDAGILRRAEKDVLDCSLRAAGCAFAKALTKSRRILRFRTKPTWTRIM